MKGARRLEDSKLHDLNLGNSLKLALDECANPRPGDVLIWLRKQGLIEVKRRQAKARQHIAGLC